MVVPGVTPASLVGPGSVLSPRSEIGGLGVSMVESVLQGSPTGKHFETINDQIIKENGGGAGAGVAASQQGSGVGSGGGSANSVNSAGSVSSNASKGNSGVTAGRSRKCGATGGLCTIYCTPLRCSAGPVTDKKKTPV